MKVNFQIFDWYACQSTLEGIRMKKIWEELEQTIKETYHISDPEWVQVHISNRGKIHTTIVSDKTIPKQEIRTLIASKTAEHQEQYHIGFIDIYTTENAKEYQIEKISRKSGYASWSDALYAAEDEKSTYNDMQIISFYSYKGGVGRTIALIETAYNLVKAGKRVLLLDLDIEAPSLHNIFAEKVNAVGNGVAYGIVEYLYRKTVQLQNDVSIEHIFCPLELQNVPGEMFLIPALKEMNKDYLYQTERLQTVQLQELDSFKEIFDYIKNVLNVDIVIIDTRSGFNKWGSLSLLTLSDQVIFVAFPNSENVEGLNIAFELMDNVGKKRYAVAMSKVISSDDGIARAKELFSNLNMPQEQLIPIFYKEEIALSSQYPITDENILSAYEELSEYILDNNRISRNKDFLANGKKRQLLKNLFLPEKKLTTLVDVARFNHQRSSAILKYNYSEELYGLKNEKQSTLIKINQIWAIVPAFTFVETENETCYENLLIEKWDDIKQFGLQLLTTVIANSDTEEKDIFPTEANDVNEILSCLKRKLSSEDIILFGDADIQKDFTNYDAVSDLRIILSISERILAKNAVQVIENIRNLITAFNLELKKIQFKFLINAAAWERHQELLSILKGFVREINVMEDDIRKFFMQNFNLHELTSYRDYVKNLQHPSAEPEIMFDFNDISIPESAMNEIIGLVLGLRQNVRVYSPSVIAYLYHTLQVNPGLKYDSLLDILKKTAEKELLHTDNTYSDRLLPFDKLQTELKTLSTPETTSNPKALIE